MRITAEEFIGITVLLGLHEVTVGIVIPPSGFPVLADTGIFL